jgi:hypothetical protein
MKLTTTDGIILLRTAHFKGSYGVMEDGIDLTYDVKDGVLKVVVRCRKLVVTKESIPFLRGVDFAAVIIYMSGTYFKISPGMEFMDSAYLMRITSVTDNDV